MSKPKWIAIALTVIVIVSIAVWQLMRPRYGLRQSERMAMLEELQPVALKNCNLKRFGSEYDGGYLLCDNLSVGIQSAYSYGVGVNDQLGCDVSKRYSVPVHQYDCFDPARPTCEGGTFVFNNECIGPRAERDKSGRIFDTLKNQISRNKDVGKRLIVKMDIEGAEWNALLATPDEVLDQIDQMPMELHIDPAITQKGLDRADFLKVIRKLKQKFYVVNLHFNNYACAPAMFDPLPAWAFQILLVNKRLAVLDETAPKPLPLNPLNAPDWPGGPDCQLPARRP